MSTEVQLQTWVPLLGFGFPFSNPNPTPISGEEGSPAANMNSLVGLGLPLLLTAGMAALHLLLPKGSLLNPEVTFIFSSNLNKIFYRFQVEISSIDFRYRISSLNETFLQIGEQDQCIVISPHPAPRFFLLYHLPIIR